MPNTENIKEVEELSQILSENRVCYLTDYRGLSVKQFESLRNKLRKSDVYVRVAKNRLIKQAWTDFSDKEGLFDYLKEPTAMILTKSDPVALARLLREYLNENESVLPRVKAIIVDGRLYDFSRFDSFADMPPPEQLRAMAVSALASPLTGLLRTLNALPQNLVFSLNAILEKKKEANLT